MSTIKAMEDAARGFDDWVLIYASEFCNEADVLEAKQRVYECHGILGYASTLRDTLRSAIEREREREKVWGQMREALSSIADVDAGDCTCQWDSSSCDCEGIKIRGIAHQALAAAERVEKGE